MIEHYIQLMILDKLAQAKALRFSELKPADMDSNAFTYHLRQLVRDGFIAKLDDGYTLSPAGLAYINGLSQTNLKPRRQPKVLAIVGLINTQNQVLLAKRKRQPSLGTWMLPSGKQHFGESPEKHIARELHQQLGTDIRVSRKGFVDLRITSRGETITHLAAHVYSGAYDGAAPPETVKFLYGWHNMDQLADNELTPATRDIFNDIQTAKPPFYRSLDVSLD